MVDLQGYCVSSLSPNKWRRCQDEHGFKPRLRSSARSGRGDHNSSRSSPPDPDQQGSSDENAAEAEPQESPPEHPSSGNQDSDHRDHTTTDAGGGPSGSSLEHLSSNLLEEKPRQKSETEAVLPRLSSEEHRRELSSGSATRPRWVSSSLAARLLWDPSHGRDTRGGSLSSAADVERTQRAMEAAIATMLQRKRRLQQVQRDIAEAECAEKRAVAAAATAREAPLRSTQEAARGAYATPRAPPRQQGGILLSEQPGDSAFFKRSVPYIVAE